MDDPELALDLHLQQLDHEREEFESSPSDSEVNGGSVVESSVEMNGVYGSTSVNKEQAYALYRHLLMQPANPRTNSLQNSVSGSEDNSSIASFE